MAVQMLLSLKKCPINLKEAMQAQEELKFG